MASFYYYIYHIDDNARIFSLVDTIEVTYSAYVSSAQLHENNVIIDSGSKFNHLRV